MSKRFLFGAILAFILIGVYVSLPYGYYAAGKTQFEMNNFEKAEGYLKTAHKLSPRNMMFVAAYTRVLFKLSPTLIRQKELYDISNTKDNGIIAVYAQKRISSIKRQALLGLEDNYINNTLYDQHVLRWDQTQFPLKVYWDNSIKANPAFIFQFRRAFKDWSNQTGSMFAFIDTPNKDEAQITINVSNGPEVCEGGGKDCLYSIANTQPIISARTLKRMDITVRAKDNYNRPFEDSRIHETALHEIGHALGIMGHSEYDGNIMRFSLGYDKLMKADVNTIKLLYKLAPNISNYKNNLDDSDYIYAPIIIGNSYQAVMNKVKDAQAYIEQAPGLSSGYIDLAAAYYGLSQYQEALEALSKALDYAKTPMEKYNIYYNFALISYSMEDYDQANKYLDNASKIQDDDSLEFLRAQILIGQAQYDKAKDVLNDLLVKDPENLDYTYLLLNIYSNKRNHFAAISLVHNLLKKNPRAIEDKRFKKYEFLSFFK